MLIAWMSGEDLLAQQVPVASFELDVTKGAVHYYYDYSQAARRGTCAKAVVVQPGQRTR